MRWVIPLFCVAAIAAIWGWAAYAPKDPPPLPERFRGRFQVVNFEPPEGLPMESPVAFSQQHYYTFREDGSYVLSVLVANGYEMLRREGVVSVDERGILSLAQVSTNRREDRQPVDRFRAEWGQEQDMPVLSLRHADRGYTLVLQAAPEAAEAAAPSSGR